MTPATTRRLAAAGFAAAATWPFLVTSQPAHWAGVSALAGVLMAASLVVTVGWLRTITFFQPAAGAVAALVSARMLGAGQGLLLVLVAAVVTGALVGLGCLALAGGRPRRLLPGVSLAVAALVALVLMPRAAVPSFARPVLLGVDLAGDRPLYLAALAVVGAALLVLRRLRHSHLGRSLAATGAGESFALRCGLDPRGAWLEGVVLAGGVAGCAGWLLALQARSLPEIGTYSLTAAVTVLAYPLLGGAGSFLGAGAVAVLLTVLPSFLPGALASPPVLAGAAVVAVAALRPDGLAGLALAARRELAGRSAVGAWESLRWRAGR